jgi:hypothetical protein
VLLTTLDLTTNWPPRSRVPTLRMPGYVSDGSCLMKRLSLAFLLCLANVPAWAGFEKVYVDRYFVDTAGWVYFSTTTASIPGTCTYFTGETFRFKVSESEAGKLMFQTLVASKLSGVQLHVWWNDVPSGSCSSGALAIITGAGLK